MSTCHNYPCNLRFIIIFHFFCTLLNIAECSIVDGCSLVTHRAHKNFMHGGFPQHFPLLNLPALIFARILRVSSSLSLSNSVDTTRIHIRSVSLSEIWFCIWFSAHYYVIKSIDFHQHEFISGDCVYGCLKNMWNENKKFAKLIMVQRYYVWKWLNVLPNFPALKKRFCT